MTSQYEVISSIAADPDVADRAYIIVEMQVAPGFHVYSVTQPKGGSKPTKITLEESPRYRQIGAFAPTEPHTTKWNDIFNMTEEIHGGTVLWLAPIEVLEGSRENLVVNLNVDGQVCDEAVTACLPVKKNLSAKFDVQDATPAIVQARAQAEALGLTWPNDVIENHVVEKSGVVGSHVEDVEPSVTPESFSLSQLESQEVSKVEGGLLQALLIAFLGGLILNVMPCVLPVISLKILSFFEQSGKSRKHAFLLNLWYSLGIISVFLVLALLSQALCTMFRYQFFSPILCCVIFAFVLTMLEVWEVRMPSFLGTGKSVALMSREGGVGAFFKGIITTLLAIPCTAPFLAAALTWVEQEMISGNYGRVLLAYLTIGLGMASPYLLIGAFPELIRFLPKPGAWMDTFKKIMGFVLLTVVVWILYFMRLPMVVPTVAVLFAIWFACWYIGKQPLTAKTGEHVKAWGIALLVVAFVFCFSFSDASPFPNLTLQNAMQRKIDRENERYAMQREEEWIRIFNASTRQTDTAAVPEQSNHWKPFSIARLGVYLEEGRPVIVDFTADWCATCKILEATVLNSEAVIAKIEAKNAVTLQADWTDGDEEITQTLKQLGGEQIPVVAIFDPREPNKPIVLRGIFRAATLLEQLEKLP
jgi:thiol:disulfide interchange protein DsbD